MKDSARESPRPGTTESRAGRRDVRRTADLFPLIRPAGLACAHDNCQARDCIEPDSEAQKLVCDAFCKSHRVRPPWPTRPPSASDAVRSQADRETSVKSLLSNQVPESARGRFLLERSEKVYKSTFSKPLGRSCIRGLQLSDATHAPNFRFGIKQTTDETNAAKNLIFPENGPSNSEDDLKLYQKTHHDYAPGQPIDRRYVVNHINLHEYRFGKRYEREANGAGKCLSGDNDLETMDVDVPQTVKDYRRICHPEVGRTTCSVAGPPNVSSGFSFGAATRHDFASAENCLKGFYSVAEQLPDVDLGKSVALRTLARGIRSEDDPADAVSGHTAAFQRFLSNPARRAQEDRRLGVPSCRTDIAAPKKRRIDDRVNYNDEPSVGQLLAPGPFEELGVLDEAFLIRRTRDDLLSLVQKSVSATYADKRVLEQAVDTALKRTAEEQSTSAMNEKEASASLIDVLDVFVEILGEQVARETCS